MNNELFIQPRLPVWGKQWPVIEKLNSSPYGRLLNEAYDRLDIRILYQSHTHGVGHIERTMLFGALVCMNESIDLMLSEDVLRCCALHDIGRIDDRYDEEHGCRSSARIAKLGLDADFHCPLPSRAAIHAHSMPDACMMYVPGEYGIEADETYLTLVRCLKDADNLDRVRIYDLDPSFLRFESTRRMVPLAEFALRECLHVNTVLCFGDSNTYGYNPRYGDRYPPFMRWPEALGALLGEHSCVIGEGMNGRTVLDFGNPLTDSYQALEAAIMCNFPIDCLIIMLGTNDCLFGTELSAEDICRGMEKLILHAEDFISGLQPRKPEIIVIAPHTLAETNPENVIHADARAVELSKELPELYRVMCGKLGCHFVSIEDLPILSDIDGIHFKQFSGQKIARRLVEIIQP